MQELLHITIIMFICLEFTLTALRFNNFSLLSQREENKFQSVWLQKMLNSFTSVVHTCAWEKECENKTKKQMKKASRRIYIERSTVEMKKISPDGVTVARAFRYNI